MQAYLQKLIEGLEFHAEKIVLGGAGLFTLALVWMYLLSSPNAIEYGGQPIGPGQLNEKILSDAKALESAVRNAKPEETTTETYSDKLKKAFSAGLAASQGPGPNLAADLRVVTPFGQKIQIPGLEESEEAPGSVTLVTPLAPTRPVVVTGRSMAFRTPLRVVLASDPSQPGAAQPTDPAVAATAAPKAVELPWVTVAAFYDAKAQYQEMTKAGYVAYRARPYIVGVEAERQEMQSTGQWSEWSPVRPGEAMPKFDAPTAVIDEASGKLSNKQELDTAFRTIKAEQWRLMQPPFYPVDAGDPWQTPPLPGIEKPALPTEAQPNPVAPPNIGPRDQQVAPQPAGPRDEGPRGGGPRGPSVAQQREEKGKALREEIKKAEEAYKKGEYTEAIRAAEAITNNSDAQRSLQTRAGRVVTAAKRKIAKAAGRSGYVDRNTLPPTQLENPDTQAPAIWFHDDTVESGKTYRYRVRVALWNRYVGQLRPLKDPAQARETVIYGDWSEPGPAVTVTPTTHFYVKGAAPSGDTVKFDVWKWRDGSWIKQGFDVAVGDTIGASMKVKTEETDENLKPIYADVDFGTGAVVLDVRNERVRDRIDGQDGFTFRDQPSTVVVYLDPADGQVKEKSQLGDKNDPMRQSLEDEEG